MEGHDLLLVGIENPLLDISAELESDELWARYELQHGQACLAAEKHLPLYDELWKL
jgi:hypothetical protein